jgi:hypothetical protein
MTDGQETHCLNSNVIQQLMQRLPRVSTTAVVPPSQISLLPPALAAAARRPA